MLHSLKKNWFLAAPAQTPKSGFTAKKSRHIKSLVSFLSEFFSHSSLLQRDTYKNKQGVGACKKRTAHFDAFCEMHTRARPDQD
jgi:hypothetical protein